MLQGYKYPLLKNRVKIIDSMVRGMRSAAWREVGGIIKYDS